MIRIGEAQIEALETPGHAYHHHAYRIGEVLIGGDVTGVKIGRGPVLPPCPPPEIHIEAWRASIARIRALKLSKIYLTHFGETEEVGPHLDALEARLLEWADWIKQQLKPASPASRWCRPSRPTWPPPSEPRGFPRKKYRSTSLPTPPG